MGPRGSPVASAEEEFVRRFMDQLESEHRRLIDALRDSWGDAQEYHFDPNSQGFDIPVQCDNEFRVDNIVAYAGLAAGNVGLLELDDRHKIVVPAGPPGIALDVKIRLKNTSKRHYSSAVLTANVPGPAGGGPAGYLYVALFGREVPIGGIKW